MSREPGRQLPGTGKSFPGNREVIIFNPHTILATVLAPVLAYVLPFVRWQSVTEFDQYR